MAPSGKKRKHGTFSANGQIPAPPETEPPYVSHVLICDVSYTECSSLGRVVNGGDEFVVEAWIVDNTDVTSAEVRGGMFVGNMYETENYPVWRLDREPFVMPYIGPPGDPSVEVCVFAMDVHGNEGSGCAEFHYTGN